LEKEIIDLVKREARNLLPEVIGIRRHLHAHPELSFEERATSEYIANQLSALNIPFTTGWAGFGIVAEIKGASAKTIALRADMDALPILEKNAASYTSKNQGIMHACGHDVHMASLLGTAKLLKRFQEHLYCTVKLIFQPGEEKLPGGARTMIEEGVLKDPTPSGIFGQHVFPDLVCGKVGICSGLYMASADEIYLEVIGQGGHAATPHLNTDVILAASQMLVNMQQIVSRNTNPLTPCVLSFGKINSFGGATNVMPSSVRLEGTFRTLDESWRNKAHEHIQNFCNAIALACGVEVVVTIERGYPSLINDPELFDLFRNTAESYLGKDNVVLIPQRMTSEDFAFYSQEIPAFFYRLGTGAKDGTKRHSVHTPEFDVDENALETGMGLMAYLALTAR
jgi:amidohydrolase